MPEDASREATKGSKPSVRPPRRIWMGFLLILVANYAMTRLFFPSHRLDHRALHRLQGGDREGQRRVDLQPGGQHRGPLQGPGHLAPGERREAAAGRCGAHPAAIPPAKRAAHGEHLRHHASRLRRPRAGGVPDRARRRDQRRADQVGRARGPRCSSASARRSSSSRSTSGCSGARRGRAAAWAGSWASARARRAATTRRAHRGSPSTTSPASTRPRTSWSRSSTS